MISYVSNTIDRLIPARYYLEDHDNIIDTIKLRYFVLILLLFLLTTPFLSAMGTYMGSLVPLIAAGIISVFGAISLILILNYQKIRLAMYTFMIAIECVLIFSTIFSTVPLDYPRLLIWIPLIEITILLFLGWKLTYPVFLINIFVVYRYLEQRAIEAGLSGAEHDKNMFGMLITIIAGHHLLIVLGYIIEQSSKRSLTQMKEHQTEELRSTHTNEVSRIVQTLSHEINNPLTYIQGVSQVLAHIAANDDIQRSKVQSIATDLATTSKKISALVSRLKTYTVENENNQNEVSLIDLVHNINFFYRSILTKNNIEFTIDISTAIPSNQKIKVNRQSIQQCIHALIDNAIEEVKNKLIPKVILEVSLPSPSNISIKVIDNGNGVEKKVQGKIFEPFFSTKDNSKHAGLGLSVTKNILLDLRGQIKYKRSNELTSFEIILPLA